MEDSKPALPALFAEREGMVPRFGRMVRLGVFVFTIFLLTLLWGSLTIQLDYDKQQTLDRTWIRSANVSATFAEYTIGVMRAMDQTLRSVKQDYEKDPAGFDPAAEVPKYAALRDISFQLAFIDADGYLAASSLKMHAERPYLGDRAHFLAHKDPDDGKMYISTPAYGRVSGRWSIQLTRRVDHPDGSFAGVIVISLDPQYFATFFSTANVGLDGFVSLVGRDDMIIRVRTRARGNLPRQDMSATELPRFLALQPTGIYEAPSVIDGIDRMISYHSLSEYPLVLVVGLARDEILADFYYRRRWLSFVGVLISITFIGAAFLLDRQIGRQARTEHELRQQSVELRHQAVRLNESRVEADLANRAKTQFLANMSHELRTPLNAIIGFSDLILSGVLGPIGSPKYLEYAGDIRASGKHLLDLINGVLDMSKIEAGRYDLVPEDIDLASVVAECLSFVAVRAEEGGVVLENRLRTDRSAVRADKRALKQILLNLLSNAVKFTPRGGCVSIAATPAADGMIAIEVADTGVGIASDDLKRIFEPFQQAESTLSRRHEGTGLGLAIAKSLVELSDGSLAVESEVGVGTTVRVRLPAASGNALRAIALAGSEVRAPV